MPDRKRPPFRLKPAGNESVLKYASSTSSSFSGVNAATSAPRKYGSTLAVTINSDSPSRKPLPGGPTSPPEGTKPVIANALGSCEVRAYVPCKMSEIAGLKALSPRDADVAGRTSAALTASLAFCSAFPARASASASRFSSACMRSS